MVRVKSKVVLGKGSMSGPDRCILYPTNKTYNKPPMINIQSAQAKAGNPIRYLNKVTQPSTVFRLPLVFPPLEGEPVG